MKKLNAWLGLLVAIAGVSAFAQTAGTGIASGPITSQATNCQPQQPSTACVILQGTQQTSQVAITVNGTFSATLQFEWSPDGGTTWVALLATPNAGGTAVSSTTGTGVWTSTQGAGTFYRVRCSAYT